LPKPTETARQKAARKAGISEGKASQIDQLTEEEFAEVESGEKTVGGVYKEKKEREAKAREKKAAKGHTPSQQAVVNPLLAEAVKYMDRANEALESALTACDKYEWKDLDPTQRDALAGIAVELSDTLNALPWGKEGK
jgi:hypothetical protein